MTTFLLQSVKLFYLTYPFFRFLSPLSAVPLVALVGFGLFELGFPGVSLLLLHCVLSNMLDCEFLLDADSCHESLGCKMCGDWVARAYCISFYFAGTDLIHFRHSVLLVLNF